MSKSIVTETEIKQLLETVEKQAQIISSQAQEICILRQQVKELVKRCFGGGKSEQMNPAQLELMMQGIVEAESPAPIPPQQSTVHKKHTPRARQKLPPHLETERIVLEPKEIQNGECWIKIGEEVTEELDMKPAKFFRRLFVRPKYVNRKSDKIAIAPLPARLIEKGMPGPGLLTQVVLSKYEDHCPLYRQHKIFKERYGVEIARSSLVEWVDSVAGWLKPIYNEMKADLLAGNYLMVDETPIRYLDPDVSGKSSLGYLWVFSRPGGDVLFEWNTSRGRKTPEEWLKNFKGHVQTDGYQVYQSLAEETNDWQLCCCWAHSRRKFVEAVEEDPKRVGWFLNQIGHLYKIEARLRDNRESAKIRAIVRQCESRPILQRIHKALWRLRPKILPKTKFGEAIIYLFNQWQYLERYVDLGHVEIDTNLNENSIRPSAIGKRNFLFIGHPDAGWRSAVIYSILGSCRRAGINPAEYLEDVLRRLPDMKNTEIKEITPTHWAAARNAETQKMAA